MEVLKRIINSKKTVLAMVPIISTLVGDVFGFDPTEGLLAVVNAAFSLLLVGQIALDYKHGSPSDGTKT